MTPNEAAPQVPILSATKIPEPIRVFGRVKYPFATLPVSRGTDCPYFEVTGAPSLPNNLIKFAHKKMPEARFVYRLLRKGEKIKGQPRKDLYGIWRTE